MIKLFTCMFLRRLSASISALWLLVGVACCAQGADWSTNEIHYQYGNLKKPFQGGGKSAETGGTHIATFQHVSGWQYGDNFLFLDYLDYGVTDAERVAQQRDTSEVYGEWYSNFSLGKITGKALTFGPVGDIGLLMGFNFAPEVDTHYYLPGVRLALELPGFTFANLDVTAYIQDSPNKFNTQEDDSYMIDFNWALPFSLGSSSWTLEGHVEYIDGADTSNGANRGRRESWILAQPQLRMDLGEALGWQKDQLFGGIEYQYWHNKLGDKNTKDNVPQLLLVWRL